MARSGTRSKGKKSERANLLKNVPLFAGCSPREMASIASVGKVVSFPTGGVICKEGQSGVGLHVVVEGEVKVQVGGRTRRRLGAGAFFGEVALLDGGPRTATVVAETPVRALVIPVWNFKSVLKSHPSIAVKMLEEVAGKLRTTESSLTH
jgi:CRP/FNR family transcriptional regulator, cyclic AMP receptor protein